MPMRGWPSALLLLLAAMPAAGQDPVYQQQPSSRLALHGDALLRNEWTRDIFVSPGTTRDENRRRLQLRPRLELGTGWLKLGVGGEFNFSSDENVKPRPALLRDNYDSKDARLDLAFAHLEPVGWLRLDGGRFEMPLALTELTWDRDLRPQGGAVSLVAGPAGGRQRLSLTVLAARGSHVFEDDETRMVAVSGEATLPAGEESKLQLTGSFMRFTDLDGLEPMIRRQNTRVVPSGPLALGRYEVVDLVARLRREGRVTSQLVADYCWNRAAEQGNRGLWLALVVGSTRSAGGRLEYTYAKVDKDATVGAYAADDFFWSTGWEGHRLDLGVRVAERTALHGVGQLQRFKDSPRPEEREQWVKRLRVEMRVGY